MLAAGGTAGITVMNVTTGIMSNFTYLGGNVANGVSIINQSGGTVTMGPATDVNTNNGLSGAGGYSYLNLTGGTYNALQRFNTTSAANGVGVVYVTNATLNSKGTYFLLGYNGAGAASQVTIGPGGLLDRTGATQILGINWTTSGTFAVLNLAGGTITNTTATFRFGGGAAAGNQTGLFNLAGGTFNTGVGVTMTNTSTTGNNYYITLVAPQSGARRRSPPCSRQTTALAR